MSDLNVLSNKGSSLGSLNKSFNKPLSGKFDQMDLARSNASMPKPQPRAKLPVKSWETKPKVDTGFKLVDVSKDRPAKLGVSDINFRKNYKVSNGIYDSGFRSRMIRGLKGTLRSYGDRSKVANLFWNKRGQGGTSRAEMKYGLRDLEKKGELHYDQVKAIRKKLGI